MVGILQPAPGRSKTGKSIDADASITIWDPASGTLTGLVKDNGQDVRTIAFSPGGKILASGGADGVVKLWSFEDKRIHATTLDLPPLHDLPPRRGPGDPFEIFSLTVSPDGRTLAISAGYRAAFGKPYGVTQVILWGLQDGEKPWVLKAQPAAVRQVAFSPDGKLLATACEDSRIRFWNTRSLNEVGNLQGDYPIAFSPDGRRLAWKAGDKSISHRTVDEIIHP